MPLLCAGMFRKLSLFDETIQEESSTDFYAATPGLSSNGKFVIVVMTMIVVVVVV